MIVYERKDEPGTWAAELISDEGDVYLTVFYGSDSKRRALAYPRLWDAAAQARKDYAAAEDQLRSEISSLRAQLEVCEAASKTKVLMLSDLCIKLETAKRIIRDTLWMAQRYSNGRRSYAVGMYNDAVRLAIEEKFVNPERDHTAWAIDGTRNPAMSGLNETENIEAIKNFDEITDLRARLETAERELGDAKKTNAINASYCDMALSVAEQLSATIDSQSAALATAREFVADELKRLVADEFKCHGAFAIYKDNTKQIAEARRILAIVDASKESSNAKI